jgi:hypothetical protein
MPIHYSVKLSLAAGLGETIFEHAPSSPGAEDYQQLVEKVADEHMQRRKHSTPKRGSVILKDRQNSHERYDHAGKA